MGTQYKFEKYYLILVDYILPLPLTIVLLFFWYNRFGNFQFASYILGLGVLYGYIVPGVAINVLHLWKFTGPLKAGNFFIHHGFIYAPYLALVFYIALPANVVLTAGNIIRIILCNAFIQCVVSCHHDICAVKTGMVLINNKASHLGKSPTEIITNFGVIGFGLVGASFAASCLIAYHSYVVMENKNLGNWFSLLLFGFLIMSFCSIPYLIKEKAFINPEVLKYFKMKKK